MNTQIVHIARNGEEIGAWPMGTIHAMRKQGSVQATDYWWIEGMSDWQPMLMLPSGPSRNPGIAAVLSLLLPGAGHLYVGHYAAGALFVLCFVACGATMMTLGELRSGNAWIVGLLSVGFVLYAAVDSARKAR